MGAGIGASRKKADSPVPTPKGSAANWRLSREAREAAHIFARPVCHTLGIGLAYSRTGIVRNGPPGKDPDWSGETYHQ